MKLLKFPKRRKNRPTRILEEALTQAKGMKCAIVLAGFKDGHWEVIAGKTTTRELGMASILWEKHKQDWLDELAE